MSRLLASLAICITLAGPALAQAPATPPLLLEATIALPNTEGRIDHLDIDLARKRLFVAELGNGSVDAVDLANRKVIHRISGLDEPQGVAYAPRSDRLLVACGGDGTVRIFSGTDFSPRGTIGLGGDADNVRLDARNGDVVVGYGSGGLAVIDPAKPMKLADVHLPAHPEGFALDAPGGRAYVNIPDAHEIGVVDFASGKLVAAWTPPRLSSNFPIALDNGGHIAAAFRAQAKIALFDAASGRMLAANETCGDADDISFDAKRKRFYVSCGAGAIDVIAWTGHDLRGIGRVSTSWGARTSLFVAELDRLFVAARDGLFGTGASIFVFRPAP